MSLLKIDDKIFVAGHKGLAGKAICKALVNNGFCNPLYGGKLQKIDKSKLNLCDNDQVSSWFKCNKPDVVIIAAAKVGGIEANKSFFSLIARISSNLCYDHFRHVESVRDTNL